MSNGLVGMVLYLRPTMAAMDMGARRLERSDSLGVTDRSMKRRIVEVAASEVKPLEEAAARGDLDCPDLFEHNELMEYGGGSVKRLYADAEQLRVWREARADG